MLVAAILMTAGACVVGCAAPAQSVTSTPGSRPAAAGSAASSGAGSASSAQSSSAQSGSSAAGPAPVRPEVPSSPLLYPQAAGTLSAAAATDGALALHSADGQTRDGEPYLPLVFTASNLWLIPTGGTTAFAMALDGGDRVGSAVQLRVSYDLTGDGSWERVETYRYFATDPLPGAERYTQDAGLLSGFGTLAEMTGGIVRLEVWAALGEDGLSLELADSELVLPYS